MRKAVANFAISMIIAAPTAYAAEPITVSEYVQMKSKLGKNKDLTLIIYLSGVADALYSANLVAAGQGKPQLYCFNSPRPLTATELIDYTDKLLADQIRKGEPVQGNFYIAVVAANAVGAALKC